jgi:hypothetical protein
MVYTLEDYNRYQAGLRREREKRQRDEDFYAKWGYYPGQRGQVVSAQDAAEREWQQVVTELQGRMDEMRQSQIAQDLEGYYRGVISGRDAPYTPEVTATLASRAAAPSIRAGREGVRRLQEAMAARGLGRSGGLGSLESRYLTRAATEAGRAAAGVRAEATQANWGARAGGAQGLAGYYSNQQEMLNALTQGLAGLRAQRGYDPSQFLRPGQRTTPSTGGFTSEYAYRPPPPAQRRQVGTTAPTYRIGAGR